MDFNYKPAWWTFLSNFKVINKAQLSIRRSGYICGFANTCKCIQVGWSNTVLNWRPGQWRIQVELLNCKVRFDAFDERFGNILSEIKRENVFGKRKTVGNGLETWTVGSNKFCCNLEEHNKLAKFHIHHWAADHSGSNLDSSGLRPAKKRITLFTEGVQQSKIP